MVTVVDHDRARPHGADYCAGASGRSRELHPATRHYSASKNDCRSLIMGRYLLLWMLGIPLPILVLIYMFSGLH
jgi:hypothetical protein